MDAMLGYMRLAIEKAKESSPEDGRLHPKVGAVFVDGEGNVTSAHRNEGKKGHAEFLLLEKLGNADLSQGTLYTTLEPCTANARNKNRPCSEWIIERSIGTVVIGMLDPNPRVYLQGVKQLQDHGITVEYFPEELRTEIVATNSDFIGQYRASPELRGTKRFSYSDNDGRYDIGHGECLFETRWSKASDTCIHVYQDCTNLKGVAVATNVRYASDISDAGIFDMSSRVRTAYEGQFVVLKNQNDCFAVLRIVDIRDSSRNDTEDELTIEYWIQDNKTGDFRAITQSQ